MFDIYATKNKERQIAKTIQFRRVFKCWSSSISLYCNPCYNAFVKKLTENRKANPYISYIKKYKVTGSFELYCTYFVLDTNNNLVYAAD